MKLIVGLGNIGKNYDNTRHNIGFEILDDFLGEVIWKKNSYGLYYKKNNILYLKPTTYMNLSGIAVSYFMKYYKIKLDDLIVIHDDIDTQTGNYKIKYDSSFGGHNGIKSIIEHLKTQKFLRIKIGISKNDNIEISDYVLGKFSKIENQQINIIKKEINEVIKEFISDKKAEYLMNKYN